MKFNEQCFNNDLLAELSSKSIKSHGSFKNIFLNTLNKHAPIKKKMIRANHTPILLRHLERQSWKGHI